MDLEHNDSFLYVLKYMYTSQLIMKNAKLDRIFDFMLIAKELQLQRLSEGISRLLIINLTIENVALIYDKANEYDQIRLKETCERFIDRNAETLVARKCLAQMLSESLEEIISRNSFKISATKIFELVEEWHINHNRTDNIDYQLLYTVRFDMIPNEELLRLGNHSKILSENIISRVMIQRLFESQTIDNITTTKGKTIQPSMEISNKATTRTYLKVVNKLASGSDDHSIKIWNVDTGRCIRTLIGHSHYVLSLHSIANNCLASGSFDNTTKIWDIDTGKCLNTLAGHGDAVNALQLLSNSYLASGSDDRTIKIWNVKTGDCIRTLIGHTNSVHALHLLANDHLASASNDNTIKIWNVDSSECIQTLIGHAFGVYSLQSLPDNTLASGSWDSYIKIWNVTSGECIRTLSVFSLQYPTIYSLQLLADKTLASGSWGSQSLKTWDTNTGKCLHTIDAHFFAIRSLKLLANNKLASGSNDKSIKIWDLYSGKCIQTLTGHTNCVTCLEAL